MTNLWKKTLLLVEDECIIAMTEKKALEKYGYTVLIAPTGEKAIEVIQSNPGIDLILMDINLGDGLDGPDTARRILQSLELPIVFLSSHTEQEIVEKTEKITSYGYVVKDSSITVLDASIKMAFKLFEAKAHAAQAAEQFRAIVENTPDCIMRYDRKGRYLYGNPSTLAVSGCTLEQFVGKTPRELGFTEELCLLWEHAIENVFSTGLPSELEFEVDLAGGRAVQQLRLSPEFNSNGSVNSAIGVSRDTSALKRTEEDLRTHQIELQMQNDELRDAQADMDALSLRHFDLYDMAPAGCFTLGETGLVQEANLSAAEILGVARNNLLKQPFTAFIEKADQEGYYRHRKILFETGVPQHCELRMRRQDGNVFNACLKAIITHDDAGEAVCRVPVVEREQNVPGESRQGV